jgi:single-strand DNA-binding protein
MASSDLNRVVLVGRLTRDPEIRQIPSGTSVVNFSIASNRTYTTNNERKEEVSYFNCLIWGKGGEVFARYAKKGQRVAIDGRLQQRRWQDKDGNNRSVVEVVTDNFQFLSYNQDGQSTQEFGSSSSQGADTYKDYAPPTEAFSDEDIPF